MEDSVSFCKMISIGVSIHEIIFFSFFVKLNGKSFKIIPYLSFILL